MPCGHWGKSSLYTIESLPCSSMKANGKVWEKITTPIRRFYAVIYIRVRRFDQHIMSLDQEMEIISLSKNFLVQIDVMRATNIPYTLALSQFRKQPIKTDLSASKVFYQLVNNLVGLEVERRRHHCIIHNILWTWLLKCLFSNLQRTCFSFPFVGLWKVFSVIKNIVICSTYITVIIG